MKRLKKFFGDFFSKGLKPTIEYYYNFRCHLSQLAFAFMFVTGVY